MPTWVWVAFNLFVILMLYIDLRVFNRDAHEIKLREALIWSAVWIGLSIVFGIGVYFFMGSEAGLSFFAGYLIEKSLSVDNIFVFLMIFSYFGIEGKYQRRILTWGILGAIVLRAIFITAGVALIDNFRWTLYIFGAFLIYTAFKMATQDEEAIDPTQNPVIKLVKRFMPVTNEFDGEKFFTQVDGKRVATPLFVALIMIEVSDIVFAVDSIPAILAITTVPFLVYTSNILAILGLRALYFALAGIMDMFHYLQYGLAIILGFVGIKMILSVSHIWHMPTELALGVVATVLVGSVVASLIWPPSEHHGKELKEESKSEAVTKA